MKLTRAKRDVNSSTLKKVLPVLLVVTVAFILLVPQSSAAEPAKPGLAVEPRPGQWVVLRLDPKYFPARVPAPPIRDPGTVGVQALPFTVNYNPPGCQGSTSAWPSAAQAAFDYAGSILASLLDGTQPIEIDACWRSNLGGNVLGQATTGALWPVADSWAPIGLANQVEGTDLNGADAEVLADFSSTANWYFGTDGNTPSGQVDFVSVVLHEVYHGLGFIGSIQRDDGVGAAECNGTAGAGCWGFDSGTPMTFDRFVENGSNQNLVSGFPNPSTELGAQLTSNNLFFDGPNTKAANGGNPARLYAPSTWAVGSSINHLDEDTYNGTQNALMTPVIAFGESAHHPGTIGLGIFQDMGWGIAGAPPTPSLSIDNVTVTEGDAGTTDAVFTVSLSPASDQPVSVDFATADNTATAGADYQSNSGSLSFPAGTTSQNITVQVNGDTADESDETFWVNLSNPSNAIIADGQGAGTITNDDTASALPSLSINNVTVTEGDAGTVNAVFTVSLSPASDQPVSVDFATADNTATAGADYQANNGSLSFPAGTTTQNITVQVNGDTADESNETFLVNLSNPSNATIGEGQGTGMITDDDTTPSGDVNGDGVVDVQDVIDTSGAWGATDPDALDQYDLNLDGIVNILDLMIVASQLGDTPGVDSDNVDDAIAISSGQTVSGQVSADDTDDVFSISASAGQMITIEMAGTGTGDADLYLYPPGTTDVASDPWEAVSENIGNDEFIEIALSEAGDWYVDVFHFEGEPVDYSVTVTLSTAVAGATEMQRPGSGGMPAGKPGRK